MAAGRCAACSAESETEERGEAALKKRIPNWVGSRIADMISDHHRSSDHLPGLGERLPLKTGEMNE